MDTDQLSEKAYGCIMSAGKFSKALRAILGAGCSNFSNEDEYLRWALDFVTRWNDNPQESWEDWGQEVPLPKFKTGLAKLRLHMAQTISMPVAERGKTAF
jgi:hypothetical protein